MSLSTYGTALHSTKKFDHHHLMIPPLEHSKVEALLLKQREI